MNFTGLFEGNFVELIEIFRIASLVPLPGTYESFTKNQQFSSEKNFPLSSYSFVLSLEQLSSCVTFTFCKIKDNKTENSF